MVVWATAQLDEQSLKSYLFCTLLVNLCSIPKLMSQFVCPSYCASMFRTLPSFTKEVVLQQKMRRRSRHHPIPCRCRCCCCCIRFNVTVASSLYISSTHVDDRPSGSDVSLLSSMSCMRVYLYSVGEYMNWRVGDRSVMMRSSTNSHATPALTA